MRATDFRHAVWLGALIVMGSIAPAAGQDEGLAGLHDKVRVGAKLCMSDHYHQGSGSSPSSKRAAEIAAGRAWSDFTALEYGNAWGSWTMAVGKTSDCGQSAGSWSCSVSARPCRADRGTGTIRRQLKKGSRSAAG